MLISIGYKREDIVGKISDPLEWEDGMDIEKYKTIAQTELEKEEYRSFLDSIGMRYL